MHQAPVATHQIPWHLRRQIVAQPEVMSRSMRTHLGRLAESPNARVAGQNQIMVLPGAAIGIGIGHPLKFIHRIPAGHKDQDHHQQGRTATCDSNQN